MRIPLDRLDAHPDRANAMSKSMRRALDTHLRATGRCPPLIVRAMGSGRHQILDGHERAEALRRLGRAEAECEVWDVDDDEAAVLLLTLNRLRGIEDPAKRGALVATAHRQRELPALAKLLPETETKLRKLIDLTSAPPRPRPPRPTGDLPHPVTFFLTSDERREVLGALRKIDGDRKRALLSLARGGVG